LTLLLDLVRAALAGRFQVEAELGRGGMAVVYRARDPKHDRDVAVKVLHAELASAIHAERFFREIRIAARLNHPNILPLLDSGQADGLLYYVMPLVTGETLRARLTREGQLGVSESLRLTGQVAAALSHAHRHGVIHRDIKPANILLQDGEALVADFGIAYALSGAGERLTETGLSVGTPEYMSPEQATGQRAVDARSDEYALACVVYEMFAGEPPLTGPTAQAVIAKLLTERPVQLRIVRDTVPAAVDEAVARALSKVPADRFESVEAFAKALTAAPMPRRRPKWPVAAAAGVGILAAVGLIGRSAFRRAPAGMTPTAATLRQITFTGDANYVAISPDGKSIAYLRDSLTSLEIQDISGGGRVTVVRDSTFLVRPRWSPDGTRILYGRTAPGPPCLYCTPARGARLFLVPRLGGPPREIGLPDDVPLSSYDAFDFGGSDSTFLLAVSTTDGRKSWLYRGDSPATIRLVGSDSVTATGEVFRLEGPFSGEGGVGRLRRSPDGRWAALAGYGNGLIATLRLQASRPRLTIVDSGTATLSSGLEWAPGSDALYFTRLEGSGGAVVRLNIDPETGASLGPPTPVQGGLSAPSYFGISADGRRLAVSTGFDRAHLSLIHLAPRLGGKVEVTSIPCGTGACVSGSLSPDGHRLAFLRSASGVMDTLTLEVSAADGSDAERMAAGLGWGPPPVWSPDARRVLYWDRWPDSSRLLTFDLSSGRRRVLWRGRNPFWGRLGLAADGKRLAFLSARGYVLLSDTVETLVSRDTSGGSPILSKDGSRLAYHVYSGAEAGTIAVLDIQTNSRRSVARDAALFPLGWMDESSLYVLRIDTVSQQARTLELLSTAGGAPRLLGVFPKPGIYSDCGPGAVTMSPDWHTAVCYTADPNTDIWLVDGFDAAHSRASGETGAD
jgi:Tol biopolymer transport system component/tRNA A-37 threonylcarbamoyl transferase component Bud32